MQGGMTKQARKARRKRRMFHRQRGRCALCGRKMKLDQATIDHIIPQSRGGSNRPANLQLVHDQCNNERGDDPLPALIEDGTAPAVGERLGEVHWYLPVLAEKKPLA